MLSDSRLNLARKWRSQSFDQVIGQELPVRMLKNGLYFGRYFPAYLLSGQRGCGKTTTARIFAAAMSCQELDSFQKNPKKVILPCGACDSCVALRAGRHPDFFEIDAASHTGVDTIRQLIEASSLAPLMGRKKIYLIDEAHMLSKAAFNALLKVLEEPPETALFMLATTDPHKIIETVRSRCFQLFFRPVAAPPLLGHLRTVCQKEEIRYQDDGLECIIGETEGSVRDALNMLEQVRFSSGAVTRDAVLSVLGYPDDEAVISLVETALFGGASALLAQVDELKLEQFCPEAIVKRLMACVRAAVWYCNGVPPRAFSGDAQAVRRLADRATHEQLYNVLRVLCEYEAIFARTTEKHALLTMVLLRVCELGSSDGTSGEGSASPAQAVAPEASETIVDDLDEDEEEYEEDEEEEEEEIEGEGTDLTDPWQVFLRELDRLNDPLLQSIFSQAASSSFKKESKQVTVILPKDFNLFQDAVEAALPRLNSVVSRVYGSGVSLNLAFTGQARTSAVAPRASNLRQGFGGLTIAGKGHVGRVQVSKRIDVSDVASWPKANLILSHFPGVVSMSERR